MYRTMNNAFKILLSFLLLSLESCKMAQETTIMAVIYNLNNRNYIFCLNNSYYVAFYMGDTDLSDEKIKELFPNVTTDTIFFNNRDVGILPKRESVFFANDIICTTKSTICDVCINDTLMHVNLYDMEGDYRYKEFSLQSEELMMIAFFRHKLPREKLFVYIDTIDINISSCNYQYLLILDSTQGEEIFFISGNNPNEPTSCTMLSEFIESLVRKHITDVSINDNENHFPDKLKKIRIKLEQFEKDYRIVPEIPVWKNM